METRMCEPTAVFSLSNWLHKGPTNSSSITFNDKLHIILQRKNGVTTLKEGASSPIFLQWW